MGEYLKSHDDIQLIFATNDRLAYAAYKVAKNAGQEQKISIVGVDGLPGANEGIDLVDKGILKATILYPTGGAEAIQTAVNILEGNPYDKEYNLSTTIIAQDVMLHFVKSPVSFGITKFTNLDEFFAR